jgi:hypothetical protein
MDDHDENDSASNPLRTRVRDTLAGVRRHGADSLRGFRRNAAEATDRLKSTAAAERLGSSVEHWRLIKKATNAQQRGNHAMAYRLLEPEVRENPDDARLVAAYWSAALACERADDAVPAVQRIIRQLASSGKPERAAELWLEMHAVAPDARVDPGALVRMVPALTELAAPEQVVDALREAVHPDNDGLSPGLAVRVAELALERDPRTALCAAHRALAAADLDTAKRARLEDLVAELERSEAEAASGALAEIPKVTAQEPVTVREPEPSAAEPASMKAAVAAALEEPNSLARFTDIQVTEAMPTQLRDEGIRLQLCGGRKVRVAYSGIAALAVAQISGLADQPVVVIDLVLNWDEDEETTLKVVRLRGDGFDPRMLMAAPSEEDATLRDFLAALFSKSDAVPLPDPNSALGVGLRSFDDLASYERDVLLVKG